MTVPKTRYSEWMSGSAPRRNPAERLNRELINLLRIETRALLSATDILAQLDKDLSWKSAYRTDERHVSDMPVFRPRACIPARVASMMVRIQWMRFCAPHLLLNWLNAAIAASGI